MTVCTARLRTCGALTVLASAALAAHANGVVVASLAPTVVTATRVEQPLADVLPSVTVLTRDDIERSQAATLADLLQGEAGFEFSRNGGAGTVTSFFLRGAASTNLIILIDGVRAPVDGYGNLPAIDLPLDVVERIELLRGNAGALYGEAAVGGVLQIFTRAPGRDATSAKVTAGSRGTMAAHAGLSRQAGDWSFRLDAGATTTNGFSALNPVQETAANPDRDGMRNRYVAARAEYALASGWQAGLQLRAQDVSVDFDDPYGVPSDRNVYERTSSTVAAYLKGRPAQPWTTRVDVAHYRLIARDLLNGRPNRGDYSSGRMAGDGDSLRWFNTWQWSEQVGLTFGADLAQEAYSADALWSGYDARRQLRGVFVGGSYQQGPWGLQANLRRDTVDVEDRGASGAEGRWSETTWLLGAGYRLTPAWRLTATLATGFRAPTVGELSYNGSLEPETYRSAEAGLSYEAGPVRGRAVLFSTRSRNTVDWSVWPPANLGQIRNRGLELSADVRWGTDRWRGSLVRQNPVDAASGAVLARRAKVYGALEWLHPVGSAELGVQLRASGKRRDVGTDLPGYATVGLSYARPLSSDWTLRIRLDNVFDRGYQLAYGYNTPGRSVLATLTYAPKP